MINEELKNAVVAGLESENIVKLKRGCLNRCKCTVENICADFNLKHCIPYKGWKHNQHFCNGSGEITYRIFNEKGRQKYIAYNEEDAQALVDKMNE
jgi:hypothetical protein